MTIDSRWIKTDFKQKYYLFCNKCEFQCNKFGSVKKEPYICKIIEIKEKKC